MDETTMIARFLFDQVGAGVTTFANEGSASLIAFIGPLAVVLLTIYVLLWGVAMASGQISEPFTDGMKRIVRMCIIVGFALTAGIYQTTIVDLFNQAPAQMANAITQGTDSQGEVTVRLEKGGRIVNGNGADTDILVASAKAYINALNLMQAGTAKAHPQVADV